MLPRTTLLSPPPSEAKFLVVRMDRIGDLVCTLPMVRRLRESFPKAHIAILVNDYNAAVTYGNTDLDAVYVAVKSQRRGVIGLFQPTYFWKRWQLLRKLKAAKFDYIVLARQRYDARVKDALRLVLHLGARHIIAPAAVSHEPMHPAIDLPVMVDAKGELHAVDQICRLLLPLGIDPSQPLPPHLIPEQESVKGAREFIISHFGKFVRPIAINISTAQNRPDIIWEKDKFIRLIRLLHDEGHPLLLIWAPGTTKSRMLAGDDKSAQAIQQALPDIPLCAYPTAQLADLIAVVSLCKVAITSEGGLMNISAALGIPSVLLYGKTDQRQWRPLNVPHEIIQKSSLDVKDISVDEAFAAFKKLDGRLADSR